MNNCNIFLATTPGVEHMTIPVSSPAPVLSLLSINTSSPPYEELSLLPGETALAIPYVFHLPQIIRRGEGLPLSALAMIFPWGH